MLESERWSDLHGLRFVARRLVEGLLTGPHAAPAIGQGQDYYDHRSYSPGDDLRQVDWKLFGRTDRHYVRRHRRLTELHAHLLVDASASMAFAGLDRRGEPLAGEVSKFHYAATLAAALAYLLHRQGDRAGLALFDHQVRACLPPGSAPTHLEDLLRLLSEAEPVGPPADVAAAVSEVRTRSPRRGLFVLFSDLLDEPEGLFAALDRLRHERCEGIVFQVLHPQEADLANLDGPVRRYLDSEQPARWTVRAEAAAVRPAYQRLLARHLRAVHDGCKARGMDHQLVWIHQPVVNALARYLGQRRKLSG